MGKFIQKLPFCERSSFWMAVQRFTLFKTKIKNN